MAGHSILPIGQFPCVPLAGWNIQMFSAPGPAPVALVPKLKEIVKQSREAYAQYCFRGIQRCSLCVANNLKSPGPIWSQENIFVPGLDVVYLAPGGIPHYLEAHSYLPPLEFVEAVLLCPDCRTDEYRLRLRQPITALTPHCKIKEAYLDILRRELGNVSLARNTSAEKLTASSLRAPLSPPLVTQAPV